MKPYGHSRTDLMSCLYGCCTTKSGKKKNCRDVVDKNNRKTARQEGKAQIFTSLIEKED